MRILLTGATGLIGRQIVKICEGMDSVELICAGRRPPAAAPPKTQFVEVDLLDLDMAEELVRSTLPTHIINAAWETRPPTYWEDLTNLAWVEVSARLARTFADVGGERFVQVGSCTEYAWDRDTLSERSTPDRPSTRYGMAKLAAFAAIQAAGHQRFQAVEGRIFYVYGPGEWPMRLVPTICRAHLLGETPQLGSGRPERDYLHSADAARALVALAFDDRLEGVVNVGSGKATSLASIAEALAAIGGASVTGLGQIADRTGERRTLLADVERLRSLGWAPQLDLEQGLRDCFDYWRSVSAD